ncbi:hypothetical protein KCU88_g5012, partial [Aureobasidium melanogenum]
MAMTLAIAQESQQDILQNSEMDLEVEVTVKLKMKLKSTATVRNTPEYILEASFSLDHAGEPEDVTVMDVVVTDEDSGVPATGFFSVGDSVAGMSLGRHVTESVLDIFEHAGTATSNRYPLRSQHSNLNKENEYALISAAAHSGSDTTVGLPPKPPKAAEPIAFKLRSRNVPMNPVTPRTGRGISKRGLKKAAKRAARKCETTLPPKPAPKSAKDHDDVRVEKIQRREQKRCAVRFENHPKFVKMAESDGITAALEHFGANAERKTKNRLDKASKRRWQNIQTGEGGSEQGVITDEAKMDDITKGGKGRNGEENALPALSFYPAIAISPTDDADMRWVVLLVSSQPADSVLDLPQVKSTTKSHDLRSHRKYTREGRREAN